MKNRLGRAEAEFSKYSREKQSQNTGTMQVQLARQRMSLDRRSLAESGEIRV